ncbi:hypothetical protein CRE_24165 [Caenorhabditis remanei]|uniref:Uncharacterized protein n=1 Tax=Caenorhabditis remanei TaxID=31234 RepID=E3N456_CAERE|nr:hypothetical protein CRE_24165 [Caenorhabditis remanei]
MFAMPRAESPKENPEATPSGETSVAESEEEDGGKNQTHPQMKEEEDEERDTSSGAETEESSSKKVSPDRPCTSSQNAPGADESRSPSAETEQTTTTPEFNSSNSTTSSRQSESPEAMEQEEEVSMTCRKSGRPGPKLFPISARPDPARDKSGYSNVTCKARSSELPCTSNREYL